MKWSSNHLQKVFLNSFIDVCFLYNKLCIEIVWFDYMIHAYICDAITIIMKVSKSVIPRAPSCPSVTPSSCLTKFMFHVADSIPLLLRQCLWAL
jgi:hypothetical protein